MTITGRRYIVLAVLIFVAVVVIYVASRGPGAVVRSRRVQLGMSIAEVREIMGPGTFEGQEFSDGKVNGAFLLAGHDEGLVNKLGQFAQDHLGADGLLTDSGTSVLILFDTDGRVVEITRGEEPPVTARNNL